MHYAAYRNIVFSYEQNTFASSDSKSELLLVVNLNCQIYWLYRSTDSTEFLQMTARSTGSTGLQTLQIYRLYRSTDSTELLQMTAKSTDNYQVYRLYNKFLSLLMYVYCFVVTASGHVVNRARWVTDDSGNLVRGTRR